MTRPARPRNPYPPAALAWLLAALVAAVWGGW